MKAEFWTIFFSNDAWDEGDIKAGDAAEANFNSCLTRQDELVTQIIYIYMYSYIYIYSTIICLYIAVSVSRCHGAVYSVNIWISKCVQPRCEARIILVGMAS